MKTCTLCFISKNESEFYARGGKKIGLCARCKRCVLKQHAENRAANIETVREKDRARSVLPHRVASREAYNLTDARKEVLKKAAIAYRNRHGERTKAQAAVNNAISRGNLKPLPCFLCGDKAEAHHPDYAAPLDVVWLCRTHHLETHALARKISRGEA